MTLRGDTIGKKKKQKTKTLAVIKGSYEHKINISDCVESSNTSDKRVTLIIIHFARLICNAERQLRDIIMCHSCLRVHITTIPPFSCNKSPLQATMCAPLKTTHQRAASAL